MVVDEPEQGSGGEAAHSPDDEATTSVRLAQAEEEARRREALRLHEQVAGERSYQRVLQEVAARYLQEPEDIRPGSTVFWKAGLKSWIAPDYGRPMIFLGPYTRPENSILIPPLFEDLPDSLVGYIDGDRDFVIRSVDRRRLRLASEERSNAGDADE